MLPALSTAASPPIDPKLNRAALPVPAALPEIPASPTRVVTTQFVPTGVTFRIVLLPRSATYRLPKPSSAEHKVPTATDLPCQPGVGLLADRKSTRLNSSHLG